MSYFKEMPTTSLATLRQEAIEISKRRPDGQLSVPVTVYFLILWYWCHGVWVIDLPDDPR